MITGVTLDPHPGNASHIRLLAGHGANGQPVFEMLPALRRDAALFTLTGSPGLVLGCATGDVLRVGDDGEFEVVEPGENVCVQLYREEGFTPESFARLQEAVGAYGGLAEAPSNLRFIVVTMGRSVGLAAIERVLDGWASGVDGAEWWFGNVDQSA
jgi:hypothetical protein